LADYPRGQDAAEGPRASTGHEIWGRAKEADRSSDVEMDWGKGFMISMRRARLSRLCISKAYRRIGG